MNMFIKVKELYSIAQKLFNSKMFDDNCIAENSKLCVWKINEIFKQYGCGDELHLTVRNGRIYYFIVNMWEMRGLGGECGIYPIVDSVLSKFEIHDDEYKELLDLVRK